jgi:hypothetical protein
MQLFVINGSLAFSLKKKPLIHSGFSYAMHIESAWLSA